MKRRELAGFLVELSAGSGRQRLERCWSSGCLRVEDEAAEPLREDLRAPSVHEERGVPGRDESNRRRCVAAGQRRAGQVEPALRVAEPVLRGVVQVRAPALPHTRRRDAHEVRPRRGPPVRVVEGFAVIRFVEDIQSARRAGRLARRFRAADVRRAVPAGRTGRTTSSSPSIDAATRAVTHTEVTPDNQASEQQVSSVGAGGFEPPTSAL
jgi:hypothetical protein